MVFYLVNQMQYINYFYQKMVKIFMCFLKRHLKFKTLVVIIEKNGINDCRKMGLMHNLGYRPKDGASNMIFLHKDSYHS